MKLSRKLDSQLIITLANTPEMRFTGGGKGIATFMSEEFGRYLIFQQWMENETSDEDGHVRALVELQPKTQIIVVGHSIIQEYKAMIGTRVQRNVFTVTTWKRQEAIAQPPFPADAGDTDGDRE